MMNYAGFDIVFQEIPGEVTLAINITGCPNNCPGCHSPHLQKNTGEPLDENVLRALIEKYGDAVTCVCFMGGDAEPFKVCMFAGFIKSLRENLKTGWYSGKTHLPDGIIIANFDYIKLGPYEKHLGGLDKPTTNQRLYRIENGEMTNCTEKFRYLYR
ncbi:MAG: anaerobic ribonucleoside-triphosphate reductase activating protein [Dysgonamonadaceae bacterium]|nr:anaerobic ribonucleoside-triphosphate reductase activating protein [Dysgonamonadaceae bacterium]